MSISPGGIALRSSSNSPMERTVATMRSLRSRSTDSVESPASPDHEHRPRRSTEHLVADAAQDDTLQEAAIPPTHDDQIDVTLVGNCLDDISRSPGGLQGVAWYA